jgi:hypothetical protein
MVNNDQIHPKKARCNKCFRIRLNYHSTFHRTDTLARISEEEEKKRKTEALCLPPTVMMRCFVVRIWLRLDSNRALHGFLAMDHYPYNRKIMKACGLTSLPDRVRTFDRRLSTISADIKEKISSMGNLFVNKRLVDPYIVAIDSTLLRAKGHLWHIIYE